MNTAWTYRLVKDNDEVLLSSSIGYEFRWQAGRAGREALALVRKEKAAQYRGVPIRVETYRVDLKAGGPAPAVVVRWLSGNA